MEVTVETGAQAKPPDTDLDCMTQLWLPCYRDKKNEKQKERDGDNKIFKDDVL